MGQYLLEMLVSGGVKNHTTSALTHYQKLVFLRKLVVPKITPLTIDNTTRTSGIMPDRPSTRELKAYFYKNFLENKTLKLS